MPGDVQLAPEEGVILRRQVGDRLCDLVPLTFGRWALKLGPAPSDGTYDAEYTYAATAAGADDKDAAFAQANAIIAMAGWDGGEPDGWVRAAAPGRPNRYRPGGAAAKEYEHD